MIGIFDGLTSEQMMPWGFCFTVLVFFAFLFGVFLFWHWAIAEGYREAAKTMRKKELIRNRKQESVMDDVSKHWRN
jgi:hypothetical protein